VPRFFAIMDGAGISERQLTMVGVDRTKKDAEGLTEKWGITRVPTFVFLRNGQEVGRVVSGLGRRNPRGAIARSDHGLGAPPPSPARTTGVIGIESALLPRRAALGRDDGRSRCS
jgi:hypothetical protein